MTKSGAENSIAAAATAALTPPAYEPLRVFGVRERDGRIEVAAEAVS